MQLLVRKIALLLFLLSAFIALIAVVNRIESAPAGETRTNNKYRIDIPGKYLRVEDAVVAVEPFAVGGHRGTLFYLADGQKKYSTLKFNEASALLERESCHCFLNTGKGVANTLYVPDPCEQYSRLFNQCKGQGKPKLAITTERGILRLGIHCTRIDGLLANCPVR